MPLPRRTFAATATVALLAAAGVTAAIAADPAPAPPPAIAFLANGRVPARTPWPPAPSPDSSAPPYYTTEQASLPDSTATALDTGDPELVIVLGGPVAISDHVIDQVETATGLAASDQPTPGRR